MNHLTGNNHSLNNNSSSNKEHSSQRTYKKIFITGGAGFIGSHFVDHALENGAEVLVYDALTYAGNLDNLNQCKDHSNYQFTQGLIQDAVAVRSAIEKFQPDAIVNFAAESHVDRSIDGPKDFIETNILGTFTLLQESLRYFKSAQKNHGNFRYVQISTDEVFGMLGPNDPPFTEKTPYAPSSPYSASKASADHLVHSWGHTYGLPTVITNCTNNYGTRQYPEKLIPHMVRCALEGKALPVYGKGENIRDWIHVSDHVNGVWLALQKGRIGEHYCFGGHQEVRNIDLVHKICDFLDQIRPLGTSRSYRQQIEFVTDRLGHDFRYAIDDSKAQKDLGYQPLVRFNDGLENTIRWFIR